MFSLHQWQENCQEQNMPHYIVVVNLSKAFDLVSRSRLFKYLQKICCTLKLYSMITSFGEDMDSMVCFSGATLVMLLQYAFTDCTEGIYLHTRTDGQLFNISCLYSRTKVMEVLTHEMHFSNDTAL